MHICKNLWTKKKKEYAYMKHSGIANGTVLTEELYTYINQKLIFLHLFTDLIWKNISSLLRINFAVKTYIYIYQKSSAPKHGDAQTAVVLHGYHDNDESVHAVTVVNVDIHCSGFHVLRLLFRSTEP